MCNKICAYFPLLSGSSDAVLPAEVQAGLAAPRETLEGSAPGTERPRQWGAVTPQLSRAQECPKCRHPLPQRAPAAADAAVNHPGAGAFPAAVRHLSSRICST